MAALWQGKWALVTGASAGIGREISKQLAADGAHLVLVARRADRLAQLAGELTQRYKVRCEICVADLTHPEAPQEILRFTQEKELPIEVLINNAGFGINGEFLRADPQRLLEMVQVNVGSVMYLARLFLPAMAQRRSGYMMVVASTAAFQAVPYLSTYAATKAFDLLFAEGIAAELAEQGVRICALCPGSTDTEFQEVAGQTERMARSKESAEKVARVGLQALAAGKPMVISGLKNRLAMESQRLAPRSWVTRAVARMFKP
jgi:hypothetical protein